MSVMSATDKLFGETTLNERQATLAKQTYGLLSLGIAGMMLGGYVGTSNLAMVQFFSSLPGWLLSLVLINLVPTIALRAAHRGPVVGFLALSIDGLISGLAISPLLFVARYVAPNAIPAAAAVTLGIFVAVTGYMLTTRTRYSAPRGLMVGIIASIGVGMLLAAFGPASASPGLDIFLSVAVGVLGTIGLVSSTSEVLNNPDFDSPLLGALCLFAGLFNIFVSALRLMIRLFASRD